MILTDALFRELAYGLCRDGSLSGLVDADHVTQDFRDAPDSARSEDDYPWIIFRTINDQEDNKVENARERVEIELVGLRSSATVGDDRLRQVRSLIKTHFKGKHKTIGKYTAAGVVDSNVGLRVRCEYISTAELPGEGEGEKSHIMMWHFTYLRT